MRSFLCIDSERSIISASFVHRTPESMRDTVFRPKGHFLYCHLEGERSMEIGGEWVGFVPGDIVLFHAGREYASRRPETAYRAMNVLFTVVSGDRYCATDLQLQDERCVALEPLWRGAGPQARFMFEDTVRRTLSSLPLSRVRAQVSLKALLLEMALRDCGGTEHPLDAAVQLVEREPHETYRLAELALRFGVSVSTMKRHFVQSTGSPFSVFVLRTKMHAAMTYLHVNPSLRVKELANMLGFWDEYHFSRTFKKHVRVSPKQYRERLGRGEGVGP